MAPRHDTGSSRTCRRLPAARRLSPRPCLPRSPRGRTRSRALRGSAERLPSGPARGGRDPIEHIHPVPAVLPHLADAGDLPFDAAEPPQDAVVVGSQGCLFGPNPRRRPRLSCPSWTWHRRRGGAGHGPEVPFRAGRTTALCPVPCWVRRPAPVVRGSSYLGKGSRFKSSAFTATRRLEPDIERAAISGRSTSPKAGSNTPAAIGIATEL